MKDQYTNPSKYSLKNHIDIALSFESAKLGLMGVIHPIHVVQSIKQANPNCTTVNIVHNIYNSRGIIGFYKATPASIVKILNPESYRGALMINVPKYIGENLPEKYNTSISTSLISLPFISAIDPAIICPISRMRIHLKG